MGCPSLNLPIQKSLNEDCKCPDNMKVSPVCAKDGVTNYYSPCVAGCTDSKYVMSADNISKQPEILKII